MKKTFKVPKISFTEKKFFTFKKRGLFSSAFIDKERETLTFSTLVFSENGYLPHPIRKCVEKVSATQKEKYPTFLEIKESTHSIFLTQKIPTNSKMSLWDLMSSHSVVCCFWAQLLKRFALEDLLYL